MSYQGIELGPGMSMEGNGEKQRSTVSKQVAELEKDRPVIWNMFNHVEETNEIEAAFRIMERVEGSNVSATPQLREGVGMPPR